MYNTEFVGSAESVRKSSFRDTLATADSSGKRIWLYPKNPKGKFTNYRTILAWALIGLMLSGPFLRIGGQPVLLMNVLERKFIILGKIFWPQDFHIFLLGMIAFVIFIALFTIVYGRVFCGWLCPQTIFMEVVFRKIEYWIEGDWKTRMALDKGPMTTQKIVKKTVKHTAFLLVSLVIANTFLGYIIGSEKVLELWTNHPFDHPETLTPLLIFTLVFYWVFAKFREQVCTAVCPYGRLQGVLLDKNSLIVAYDYVRGEKRAKFRKSEARAQAGKGDCIDCNQCVNVCPMGIDIRNGTQLECTNCTACIDACNFMMKSVGLEQGLIRFDSEAGIAEKKKFKVTPKIIGYSIVLVALIGFIASLLILRTEIQTSVLRTPGVLFQKMPGDKISNLYNIKIINKTNEEVKADLRIVSGEGEIKLVGKALVVPSQGVTETAAFIILDHKDIKKAKTKIKIGVYSGDRELETVNTTFIGPVN